MSSLIYRSAFGYECAMRALYGRNYATRYHAVADLIPAGATVLDVCCGPAVLYRRYLRQKGVVYEGVDANERFVAAVRKHGARGHVIDLHDSSALPNAEFVVMQASLYQFLPDAAPIVERLYQAASRMVIVAEPVRNLADSPHALVRHLAGRFSNAGRGPERHRFTEPSLDALFERYEAAVMRSFLIPGGREKVYVLVK